MLRPVRFAPVLALVSLLWGCQDSGTELPSAPASGRIATTAEAEAIREMIRGVFPGPGLENAALKQFDNVERQLYRGETADAVDKTLDLILFTLGHFENGRLDGSDADLALLLNAELVFVGVDPIFPDGGLGSDDFAVAVCDAGESCLVVTATGFAGLRATFLERTLVTIVRLADDPGPFDAFGFADFPRFYDIRVTSVADAVGTSGALAPAAGGLVPASATPVAPGAVAGVCVAAAPDPFAPPAEIVPDLRLAHVIDGVEGPDVEILALADADFLDCGGDGTGLGGVASAFSPFGAVDPASRNDEPEGGPTTTTLLLNGMALNLTISQGQTATATAIVDPAPGNALAPLVNYFWPTFPGGITPTTSRSLVDGEAVLEFLCDATGTLTPTPGVVEVGSGSRFVRASFPGAGDFEPSVSGSLILSCVEGES